ncbi:unnamed protein product [Mytilus coruscus]|uniref:Uncharacterized protein n=1 Tax=Mytilus coruscus TaxID=42192 RepID=A0A6J8EML9_MYTCO|nr:unnamed protein product [Mytilus coruscus]
MASKVPRRHGRFRFIKDDFQNNDSNDDVYRVVSSSQDDDTESEDRNDDASTSNVSMPPVSVRPGQKEGMVNILVSITGSQNVKQEIESMYSIYLDIYSGYVSMPPVSVRPGQKEGMIAHKHGYTMTGSSGIVSWLIRNKERRVVIVWRSPFLATNTMAVCLTTVGKANYDSSWFSIIIQRKIDANLKYKCFTYDNVIREIMI